jgi:hypothetical protein
MSSPQSGRSSHPEGWLCRGDAHPLDDVHRRPRGGRRSAAVPSGTEPQRHCVGRQRRWAHVRLGRMAATSRRSHGLATHRRRAPSRSCATIGRDVCPADDPLRHRTRSRRPRAAGTHAGPCRGQPGLRTAAGFRTRRAQPASRTASVQDPGWRAHAHRNWVAVTAPGRRERRPPRWRPREKASASPKQVSEILGCMKTGSAAAVCARGRC